LSLISPFVPSEKRPALNNLPYFLAYLEEKQTFDNTKSDVFFVKEGLRIRPVSEYLGKIVEYYRNNLPNKGRNGEPYERRR
jgi:hypothetical protein